jgi:crossover junction endodeoxyribonuclease RuvC
MYVSGIDCSVTAAGIAVAPLNPTDPCTPPPFATHVIGVDGVQNMAPAVLIATLDDLAERIVRLACPVELVSSGNVYPEAVLMEAPTAGKLVSGGVFERGYLFYTVAKLVLMRNVRLIVANNSHIKQYVTGKGNAGKGAVIDGIARRFPMFDTDGHDGRADAAGCAALCAAVLGSPLVDRLPAPHLLAVEAVTGGTKRRPARTKVAAR